MTPEGFRRGNSPCRDGRPRPSKPSAVRQTARGHSNARFAPTAAEPTRPARWQRLLCFVGGETSNERRKTSDGRFRPSPAHPMPYRVIAFTMAQVRQGALDFQRQLSAVLRELPEIKVYSVSPFDLDERRRFKDRFGGDIVYFLNDAAWQECERSGVELQSLGEISEDELPRRRTLVVGMPERTGGNR